MTVSNAVGKSVVVKVWIESQPSALVNCETTTPVSAGLQEVAVAKVWSEELIVRLNVVIESQPLAAPVIMVSLNEVEAKYQVPSTCVESQSVILTISKAVGNSVVVTVWIESQPKTLVNCETTTPVSAGLQEVAAAKVWSE